MIHSRRSPEFLKRECLNRSGNLNHSGNLNRSGNLNLLANRYPVPSQWDSREWDSQWGSREWDSTG